MEFFLNKVSQQAVTFAIRSGISITTTFAVRQCGHYLSSYQGQYKRELGALKDRLESKIRIIAPAIDLVEIISARGNTSLESALTLTKDLRNEIEALGLRIANLSHAQGSKGCTKQDEVQLVMSDIKRLLGKIEDAVPYINLAISTSGAQISPNIPHSVSPVRLLQASTLLTAGDTAYCGNPFEPAQIGQTLTLSLYMLFSSHSHRQELVSAQDLTWQEVIFKCRVKLLRVPLFYEDEDDDPTIYHVRAQSKSDEFCYELCLVEDLDDGRVHDDEAVPRDSPSPYEDVGRAGLIARIPVHEISKMFYTTSGKILGIEESSSPILLIKRENGARPPRRLEKRARHMEYLDDGSNSDTGKELGFVNESELSNTSPRRVQLQFDHQKPGLPRHLDQEWLAFEVFTEREDDSDNGSQESEPSTITIPASSPPTVGSDMIALTSKIERLELKPIQYAQSAASATGTLSILECLLRLSILQNYEQTSHLAVHDEILNLFLSDSLWAGSREAREAERKNAKQKLGFDPYNPTPSTRSKRRVKQMPLSSTATPPKMRCMPYHTGAQPPQILKNEGGFDPELPPISSPIPLGLALQERQPGRIQKESWTPERQLSSEWTTTADSSYVSDTPSSR